MSKLVHLSGTRHIREQAAMWLVCLEEGLSERQKHDLNAWLAADAAHGAALVRMAKEWDAFDALTRAGGDIPPACRIVAKEPLRPRRWALAAVALGAIAVALYFNSNQPVPADEMASTDAAQSSAPSLALAQGAFPVSRSLHTSVGQHLTSKMPDGSSISLNTDTTLTVEFSENERLVVLEKGEASFSVAHDASRPFRVKAGERTVQAVGTVFDVRRQEGRHVRVTVTEGVVKVINQADSSREDLLVRAGQLADISDAASRWSASIPPASMRPGLAAGRVDLRGARTLEDVVADVSRYTDVRFRIEDDSIRQRRVGGVFRTGDVEGLLLALRESFGIEPNRQGDIVVLSAKK
ncbi:MAG: FecR domain-containing protein [Gammaproteobacteria bacterium]